LQQEVEEQNQSQGGEQQAELVDMPEHTTTESPGGSLPILADGS